MLVFAPSSRHYFQPEASLFDYSAPTYRHHHRRYALPPYSYLNESDVAELRQAIYEEEQARRVKAFIHQQYLAKQQQLERERRLREEAEEQQAKIQAFLAYRKRKEEAALRHAAKVRAVQQEREKEMQLQFLTLLLSSAMLADQQAEKESIKPVNKPAAATETRPKATRPSPSKANECNPRMCGSAWYGVPSDKVYYEVVPVPAPVEESNLKRKPALKRNSQPQPQPQPAEAGPEPKVQSQSQPKKPEVVQEPEPVVDYALSRKTSLSSLGLIRAEYDLFKLNNSSQTSISSPKEKAIYSAHLLKFLERVDGVESDGDDSVRTIRRSLAKDLQAELDSIESESVVATPTEEEKKVRFEDEVVVPTAVNVDEAESNVVPPVSEEEEVAAAQLDGSTQTEEAVAPVEEVTQADVTVPDEEDITSTVVVTEKPVAVIEDKEGETVVDIVITPVASDNISEEPVAIAEAVVTEEDSTPAPVSQQPEESQPIGLAAEDASSSEPSSIADAESSPAVVFQQPEDPQQVGIAEEIAHTEPTPAVESSAVDATPLDVDVDVHSVSSESSEELETRSAESESDVGEDVVLLKSDGEEEVERKVTGGYELL